MIRRLISEGSYDDFLTSYGKELREAVRQLKDMTREYKNMSDEKMLMVEKAIKIYDKNVGGRIEHWIFRGRTRYDDIAKFAIENMNRYGTEPQMITFAIEDVYDIIIS